MTLKQTHKLKNKHGFTFSETIVSTLIGTFIVAGLATTLNVGNKYWRTYGTASRTQKETRLAMDTMARDLRASDNVVLTQTTSSVDMSFSHPSSGNVTYNWATTGNDANRIIRQTTSTNRIIANNISALSFTDTTDDITIDVTARVIDGSGEWNSFQLVKKVAKR